MPASKMRLKTFNHSILKDKFTVAFYNLIDNSMIELGIKERGRRKK
jgi:hypothetical protein